MCRHINSRSLPYLNLSPTIMYHHPGQESLSRFDTLDLDRYPIALRPASRQNRSLLPTPPSSTRTSLEESQGLQEPICATQPFTQLVVSPTKADVPSCHLTPPPSPSSPGQETSSSILKSLRDVASRVVSRLVFENVSAPVYEEVVEEATKNGDWQDVR